MSQTTAELIKLPKDSLVNMAISKIDEPSFDVRQFDQISVWSIRGEVWVFFDRFIKFIPPSQRNYYDAKVSLATGQWTTSPLGTGKPGDEKFYSPSSKDKSKVDFVMAHLSPGELPPAYIEKLRKEGDIMILDENDHYSVSVSEGRARVLFYKVRKKTGEVFDKSELNNNLENNEVPIVRIY